MSTKSTNKKPTKRELQRKVTACKKTIESDPGNAENWQKLGDAYYKLGNYEEAAEAYKQAVKLEPENAKYLFKSGQACHGLYQEEDAIKYYRKATRLEPENSAYWDWLAKSFYEINRYKDSASALRKSLKLDADNAWGWKQLGRSYSTPGNYAKAIKSYKKSAGLEPEDETTWYYLGASHYNLGQYEDAVEAFKKAAKLKPNNAQNWLWLGASHSNLGHHKEAVEALGKAVALDSGNVTSALWWLGNSYKALSDYTKAYEAYNKYDTQRQKNQGKTSDKADGNFVQPESKPRIMEGIVDLKLTEDGKIQICEFGNMHHSAFEGFRNITGKDMIRDVVAPFHKKLLRQWRKDERYADALEGVGTISMPQNEPFIEALTDQTTIYTNADPGFTAFCRYKDQTLLRVPEAAQQYFPRGMVFPISERGLNTAKRRLTATFGKDEDTAFVMKPCDAFVGSGVEIHRRSDLLERLSTIVGYRQQNTDGNVFWEQNSHPNLVIQECVQSTPIKAEDGELYDATMRVVFTTVLHPGEEKPEIHFHGAYWKLPGAPYNTDNSEIDPDAIISVSPSKSLKAVANSAFKARPASAPVSGKHKAMVEEQLKDCLGIIIPEVAKTPKQFLSEVRQELSSRAETRRGTGVELATNSTYGGFLATAFGERVQSTLLERLNRIINGETHDCGQKHLQQCFLTEGEEITTSRKLYAALNRAKYAKEGLQLAMA